jgi:hypothetical protein
LLCPWLRVKSHRFHPAHPQNHAAAAGPSILLGPARLSSALRLPSPSPSVSRSRLLIRSDPRRKLSHPLITSSTSHHPHPPWLPVILLLINQSRNTPPTFLRRIPTSCLPLTHACRTTLAVASLPPSSCLPTFAWRIDKWSNLPRERQVRAHSQGVRHASPPSFIASSRIIQALTGLRLPF